MWPGRRAKMGIVSGRACRVIPPVDVDDSLLADYSFREVLAALDFRATFEQRGTK